MNNKKHVCVYCGNEANYQLKNGKWCCQKSHNQCPYNKEKRRLASLKQWQKVKATGNNKLKGIKTIDKDYQSKAIVDVPDGYCQYGCGNKASYVLKNGVHCCSSSANKCPALRIKNSNGLKRKHEEVKKLTGNANFYDYQLLPEETKKCMSWNKGHTKQTHSSVKQQSETFHQNLNDGKFKPSWLGRHHTKESLDSLVRGMINSKKFGKCRGRYKNYRYDSSWELAWIVYHLDNNIPFERNYKGYYYISPKDNKRHKYYPDFIIDDTIIEIKGWVNDVSLAKINAVKNDYKLKIIMIDKTDIQKYIEYAILKYGEHFYLDLKD